MPRVAVGGNANCAWDAFGVAQRFRSTAESSVVPGLRGADQRRDARTGVGRGSFSFHCLVPAAQWLGRHRLRLKRDEISSGREEHLTRWLADASRARRSPSLKLAELAHAWLGDRFSPELAAATVEESQAILDRLG
jgi:hypothetical protein